MPLAVESGSMTEIVPEETARFARALGPQPDAVLTEMDERAKSEEFPHVGPEVGGWLQFLAGFVEANQIFEFGSGFGYSAYWFARALPEDGEIVLTEIDDDELEAAREYLARGGYGDRARFELGDALETIEDYEGPFDVVLVDHDKPRYVDAFETVKDAVSTGGILVADNAMTAGIIDFDDLSAGIVDDDLPQDANENTRGIYRYLTAVRDDPNFETVVLPLGEGIAVSRKTG